LFQQRLQALEENCQWIREVRVVGMMIGIELDVEGGAVVEACMANDLLVNCTQGNVVRLLPAMTLTEDQAEQGCQILADAIQGLNP
jgi:acetylornithine/succinyldiaminopimelate/putrescine aminotransferase